MNKYNEIMEHIELTDEMRERIIGNIGAIQRRRKIERAVRLISAAAACVVIAVGSIAVFNKTQKPKLQEDTSSVASQEQDSDTQAVWTEDDFENVEELSEAFGLELHDVDNVMPFKVQERSYDVLFDSIAEINYYGADDVNCCIRAGKDTEDVSGDYNEYTLKKEAEINGVNITLKGNDNRYYLATWIKDGHFYAVSLSDGADEQKISDIVLAVIGEK